MRKYVERSSTIHDTGAMVLEITLSRNMAPYYSRRHDTAGERVIILGIWCHIPGETLSPGLWRQIPGERVQSPGIGRHILGEREHLHNFGAVIL